MEQNIEKKRRLIRQLRREVIVKVAMLLAVLAAVISAGGFFAADAFGAENVPCSVDIPVRYELGDQAGTVRLIADDPEAPMPAGSRGGVKDLTLRGSGETSFGTIRYERPDIYTYTVRRSGDDTVYHVRVIATSDGQSSVVVMKEGVQGKTDLSFSSSVKSLPLSDGGSPGTGDGFALLLWLMLCTASATILLIYAARAARRSPAGRKWLRTSGMMLCTLAVAVSAGAALPGEVLAANLTANLHINGTCEKCGDKRGDGRNDWRTITYDHAATTYRWVSYRDPETGEKTKADAYCLQPKKEGPAGGNYSAGRLDIGSSGRTGDVAAVLYFADGGPGDSELKEYLHSHRGSYPEFQSAKEIFALLHMMVSYAYVGNDAFYSYLSDSYINKVKKVYRWCLDHAVLVEAPGFSFSPKNAAASYDESLGKYVSQTIRVNGNDDRQYFNFKVPSKTKLTVTHKGKEKNYSSGAVASIYVGDRMTFTFNAAKTSGIPTKTVKGKLSKIEPFRISISGKQDIGFFASEKIATAKFSVSVESHLETRHTLVVHKESIGEGRDPEDSFEFKVKFSELTGTIPGYRIYETETDEEIQSEASYTGAEAGRTATFAVQLKAGQSLRFTDITGGAKYRITEAANSYCPSFSVVKEAGTISPLTGSGTAGSALSTGTNVMPNGSSEQQVEFTFVNAADTEEGYATTRTLKVTKKQNGGEAKRFSFTATFKGLSKDRYFVIGPGNASARIAADPNGDIAVTVSQSSFFASSGGDLTGLPVKIVRSDGQERTLYTDRAGKIAGSEYVQWLREASSEDNFIVEFLSDRFPAGLHAVDPQQSQEVTFGNLATAASRGNAKTYDSGIMYLRLFDGMSTNEYRLDLSWDGSTPDYGDLNGRKNINVTMTPVSGGEGMITATLGQAQVRTSKTRFDGVTSEVAQYFDVPVILHGTEGYQLDTSYGNGLGTTREIYVLTREDDSGLGAGQTANPVFSVSSRNEPALTYDFTETKEAILHVSLASTGLATFHGASPVLSRYWRFNQYARDLYFKLPEGTGAAGFDHTVNGIEFNSLQTAADGSARHSFDLGDGAWVQLLGLDQGASYEIMEHGTDKFIPEYSVSKGADSMNAPVGSASEGDDLFTQEEELRKDTVFDFVNTKTVKRGTDITTRKELSGGLIEDADRMKAFEFRCYLAGLDPEETYTINMEGATNADGQPAQDITITPSAAGTASGLIRLHGGEEAVIENLPPGAKYAFGETGAGIRTSSGKAEYTVWYQVTEGSDATEVDYRFYPPEELAEVFAADKIAGTGTKGAAGTYGYETVQEDSAVTYTFTNAKYRYIDVTFQKKRTKDGEEITENSGRTYDIEVSITGLKPDTEYQVTGGSRRSDAEGSLQLSLALKAADSVTVFGLPTTAKYTVEEKASAFTPSLEAESGGRAVFHASGEFGRGFRASFSGLTEDSLVTLTNEEQQHADLQITKEFDGLFRKNETSASFTVHLTGLEEGRSYTARKLDAEGNLLSEETLIPEADGSKDYGFSLKDRQSLKILRLPVGAGYSIEEAAQEGVTPSYVVTSTETEDLAAKAGHAEKGQPLRTAEEKMTTDRSYSFYNTIPDEPVKTVSDGDGLTKTGAGEEKEVTENYVPKKSSSWIYHISQEVPVPVASFRFVDQLPAYVRADVYDSEADISDAPFRVYWRSPDGSSSRGGAITEYNKESGEYYVRDAGGSKLFTVIYDPDAEGPQSRITVTAEDEQMLLEGGIFDIYFKAYLDRSVSRTELIAADEYDGVYYRFENSAVTFAGAYTCETNPVTTIIPETEGLTVQKVVSGPEERKEEGKTFGFRADFTGLVPGKTYIYRIPSVIQAGLVMSGNKVKLTAADQAGKTYKDVTARVMNGEGLTVANLNSKSAVTLPKGEYTVVYEWGDISVTEHFEIISRGADQLLQEPPVVRLYGSGEELSFQAAADGRAHVDFELTDQQRAVFTGLPGESRYEITERAAEGYAASYQATAGMQSMANPAGSNGRQTGKELSTGVNTYDRHEDVTITYTNAIDEPAVSDLILKKKVTGNLGDLTKEFEFTVKLEGLAPGKEYEKAAEQSITAPVKAFKADAAGEAELHLKLKGGEEVCIPGLPEGAAYRITEAASDHVASYRLAAEQIETESLAEDVGAAGPAFAKEADTNGFLSDLSLATERETVDPGEKIVRVTFTNNRDLSPLTGIPARGLFLAVCLAMICLALTVYQWKKTRRGE